MHLTFDLYLMVLRGELPPSALVDVAHKHLLECCSACKNEWTIFRQEGGSTLPVEEAVNEPQRGHQVKPRHRSIYGPTADQTAQDLERMRREKRKARQDLSALLKLPPEDWERRIENAQTRFRSRAFAELLLAEARRRVRNDPNLAYDLASLIPVILHWIPGDQNQPWRMSLDIRSRAMVANALRVQGELAKAAKVFADVRRALGHAALNEPETHGEIASLEASLRIAQRQLDEAVDLLSRSVLLYNISERAEGLVRVLIKRANVHQSLDQPTQALESLDRAAKLLDADDSPFLHLCTVTTRVLCLCDLDRPEEAWELLQEHLELYEGSDDAWVRVSVQDLRGRVLLGLGRHEEAAEAFAACRDGALELGRDYDAALASLDLALVYLEQGRTGDLRELAAELVPTFQARGVDREALAALRLFQQAVTTEELSRNLLADLRERLQRSKACGGMG